MSKKQIRKQLDQWNCIGRYGYGQGKAVAVFGEDAVRGMSVCDDVCPRSGKCRAKHAAAMDERFPDLAVIVKKTVATAKALGTDPVQTVMSAMRVAVGRENVEALRVKEGLKRFGIGGEDITDHYVYGQLENLDNGLQQKSPDTKPNLILIGSSYE